MKTFFNPASIAVIGATPASSLGGQLTNLRYGYTGRLYPVNPNCRGYPRPALLSGGGKIPGEVDLAIVIVPAPARCPRRLPPADEKAFGA